ncbi:MULTISPECIES: hypothetical protein [unclassified Ruegeria]|uniref:hypothetical protein n=1 Tax=unclassified Ruegeria TaxID=2625375 RepID=UPI001487EF65|nr:MULTISPECIES: hypothetical protein [unclassified Ruegeria]NOD85941.1 hypothetical protein [Ruegeria sp. HKCCD6119]
MQRAKVQLPWISMMDLLFGLFGGLIILAMIITLKLGQNAGIESRPYALITVSVVPAAAGDTGVQAVLERMHLAFDVKSRVDASGPVCLFSAAADYGDCEDFERELDGAPVRFSTSAKGTLSASLFIGSVEDTLPATHIRPALRDIAQFLGGPANYESIRGQSIQFRLSVKFGGAFFEPTFAPMTIEHLIELASASPHLGKDVPIVPEGTFDCSKAQNQAAREACARLKVMPDGFVFE